MKNDRLAITLFLSIQFLTFPYAGATDLVGTELEVGPTGSNQVLGSNSFSGAIGYSNSVNTQNSLAIGNNLNLYYGSKLLAHGASSYFWMSSTSGAFGTNHDLRFAYRDFLFGYANKIFDFDDTYAAVNSLATGTYNRFVNAVSNGFATGSNNELYAHAYMDWSVYEVETLESASVLGRGLINRWNYSTVVGQFNDSSIPHTSVLLFAVGNGASATQRSNALEVYQNGTIKMPRQGDILMGEFGD